MSSLRLRLGLGRSLVFVCAVVLAHCTTSPSPAGCPEGQEPDADGNCQPVVMPCEGADCPDAGMMDGGAEPCQLDIDCDDGSECTDDTCASDGTCTHAAKTDGLPCDFEGAEGICSSGLCEDAGPCRDVDCSDGVDCTDDLCVDGVCMGNVPNDGLCEDGDTCTESLCDPVGGCINPDVPDYSACDDGASATAPDVCRAGACIGAAQGKMSLVSGGTAVDIVKTKSKYVVLVNTGFDVELHELTSVSSSTMLGAEGGTGNRLHTRGDEVYVAAQTNAMTSGGLNCNSEFSGRCPLVGVYPGSGQVQWNGTALHNALNGLGMSAVHDISDVTIGEMGNCQICAAAAGTAEDVHWWFVGQRLGLPPRPLIVYCLQLTETVINCQISIAAAYNKGEYDNFSFVGVETPVDTPGILQAFGDPDYNTGVFGLDQGSVATVKVDPDTDPDNQLPDGDRDGPFDTTLRGSFKGACNMVIEYGDGGSMLCSSDNLDRFFRGCEAEIGTAWSCSDLLTGENFVHGTMAVPVPSSARAFAADDALGPECVSEPTSFPGPPGTSVTQAEVAPSTSQILANVCS